MKHLTLLLVICLLPGYSSGDELKPFTSDGCSSFPDGTWQENRLWLSCCKEHDRAYWQGGTYQQRLNADNRLNECVAAVGKPNTALLMLAGVRVGGSPYFPTTFRWGYGWPYPRNYGELTEEELLQVKQLTEP
ncbi:hypothetical protein [uncultured Amphritea sp.]|uniref:hypothetical protein n=1 Tax=Amphritea sp. TaxID=1872502 RepID=UPI0025F3C2CE|nr:hypothetical protein [uncultured Amphritea sp.]